jgi:dCTP deaminase
MPHRTAGVRPAGQQDEVGYDVGDSPLSPRQRREIDLNQIVSNRLDRSSLMAFWNTTRIKHECQTQELITPYREDRAKRCAYELAVGNEAFVTSKSEDTAVLPKGVKVSIPPGQFGLLTTYEVVFVPNNAIAFISMRAKIKFQGLVNVSGFHVDPGYRGKLRFAVYNAGSKTIVLDQDEPIFMIWYADLDAPTPDPYSPLPALENVITAEDVSRIQGEVASPAELKKQIEELRNDLRERFHSIEQSRLYNRALLTFILTLVGSIIVGTVVAIIVWGGIKPAFEGAPKRGDSNSMRTMPAGPVTSTRQAVTTDSSASAGNSSRDVPSTTDDSAPDSEKDADLKRPDETDGDRKPMRRE